MTKTSLLRLSAVVAALLAAAPGTDAPVRDATGDHAPAHDTPGHDSPAVGRHSRLPIEVCFAPGTPESYMAGVRCRVEKVTADIALYQADDGDRWSSTSTNGSGLGRGDPTTLTWGIVPDGTEIGSFSGEGAAPSNLRAMLDDIYGDEATWLPIFRAVFERWSEVSGITYVHESEDDGVALGFNGGRLGVRPDIRIGGHTIDGDSGTLGYNFFPNASDMVLDTSDRYFRTTSSNSLRLRNVLAHEHGHGLGLDHVCPVNQTKLMEPLAGVRFDGPQLDDILAGQRLYGDTHEPNDGPATAADLGTPATVVEVATVSIDGRGDVDVFAFDAPAGARANVVVRPVGATYAEGPQVGSSCGSGTTYDSLRLVDLEVSLLSRDGTSVLATAAGAPAGQAELLDDIGLAAGAGTYYVRVAGDGTDDVQLYQLEIEVTAAGTGAPVAADDVRAVSEDSPTRVDVLANDAGTDGAVVSVSAAPQHGTTEVNEDGSITYRPAPNYVGGDSFEYSLRGPAGRSSSATVTIDVIDSPRAGLAKIDSDEDLYPDELEVAVGTAADDVVSAPSDAAPGPMAVAAGRFNVNFRRRRRDRALLRARIPLEEGFEVDGAVVTVYVGGVVREFTLNARGVAGRPRAADRMRLFVRRPGGVVPAQDARLDLVIRRQDLAETWADEGLTGEARQRRAYREMTIFVLVDGSAHELTLPLSFTARPRRGGAARLIR